MKIEDLQETAALAHLNMDEKELAGAFPAFEQMLGYFAAMQAAPMVWMAADKDEAAFTGGNSAPGDSAASAASGISAVSRTLVSNHFRPDILNPNNNASDNLNENLLNNAGERDGRFVVIPNVL